MIDLVDNKPVLLMVFFVGLPLFYFIIVCHLLFQEYKLIFRNVGYVLCFVFTKKLFNILD